MNRQRQFRVDLFTHRVGRFGLVVRISQDVFEFILFDMSMTRGGLCSIKCMNYVEKHLMYFHIPVHVSRKKFFLVPENIQQFPYIYVTSHKFSNKEATMLCVLFSDCELNFVKAKSCCIMYIRNLYQWLFFLVFLRYDTYIGNV